jgi:hypothetical protein
VHVFPLLFRSSSLHLLLILIGISIKIWILTLSAALLRELPSDSIGVQQLIGELLHHPTPSELFGHLCILLSRVEGDLEAVPLFECFGKGFGGLRFSGGIEDLCELLALAASEAGQKALEVFVSSRMADHSPTMPVSRTR